MNGDEQDRGEAHAGGEAAVATAPAPAPQEGTFIPGLLVEAGVLTEEQRRYAERVRSKLPAPKPLLAVLKDLQLVGEEEVRTVLREHRLSVRLGTLLVELGYLQAAELEAALAMQREAADGAKLGEVLVKNRFIDEATLYEILAYQLGFTYVPTGKLAPHPQLSRRAPVKFFAEHRMVPTGVREDGEIEVVFADPLDRRAHQAAAQLFGSRIAAGIARPETVEAAIAAIGTSLTRGPGAETRENAIVAEVNALVRAAIAEAASDIHIEPLADHLRIRFRQDGVLVTHKELPLDVAPPLTSRIKILAGADIAERRRHQDGRMLFDHQGHQLDMRVSIYSTIHGEKVVLRLLNKHTSLLDIRELGLSPRMQQRFLEDALDAPSGVVIVTGPTGSGKTTTLYGSVAYLNQPHTSIVTAEDPVEYVIDGIAQCSINPKISVTYEETLRHIVRQDPDVIVIGEIRDLFSAEIAIQAALTGHKVLTTFHTEDSIGGLLRLLNMNIEAFLISSTVVSVLAQRLVRRVCPHCAEDHVLTPHELRRLGYDPKQVGVVSFKQGRGCARCRYLGHKGRVAVFELLVLNELVKDALIARKTSYEIRRISTQSTGLVTLLEDGIWKAAQGQTSYEEIVRHLPRLAKPRPLQELRRLQGEAS